MKPAKLADIIDVANAAGVSPATVSRSFNHPDKVKPDTRKRIQTAIEQTGYIRNRAAQAIHGKRSGTIGLIVPTLDNAIFANLIQAFSDQLALDNFTMLVSTHGYDLDREYSLVRSLLEHRVEGVALIGLDHRAETFALLNRRGTPTLTMWNYNPKSPIPCVGTDNAKAGRLVARHLAELGHRQIGLVFPTLTGNDRAEARLNGVKHALGQAGIDVPDRWNLHSTYSVKAARAAGAALFQSGDMPTALIAGNDVIAQGLIFAAQAHGLRVPQDISISGFGDFSGSADLNPRITTVRLRSNAVGQTAAVALSRLINQGADADIGHSLIDVELMIRESTARI